MPDFICFRCDGKKEVLTYAFRPQPNEDDPSPTPCPFCSFPIPEPEPELEPSDGPFLAMARWQPDGSFRLA